jgi:hypothetical protein
LGGTHITLKTRTDTLEVHLGPTAFLNEKNVAISKGDTLVIGSRVAVDAEPVFIAKEVKKGDSVWTLRDGAGLPFWRGAWRTAVSRDQLERLRPFVRTIDKTFKANNFPAADWMSRLRNRRGEGEREHRRTRKPRPQRGRGARDRRLHENGI